MPNRIKHKTILLFCVCIMLLTFLIALSYSCRQWQPGGTLVCLPIRNISTPSQQSKLMEQLDEIHDEKYLLTYQSIYSKTAKAATASYTVELVATNHAYPLVMDKMMISGGFFSHANQEQKSKRVVLNEQAAFNMYGGYDIVGVDFTLEQEKYIVVGVIADKRDENVIYAPSTCFAQDINRIEFSLKEGTGSDELLNYIKQYNITQDRFIFIDTGLLSDIIEKKPVLALKICAILIVLYALIELSNILRKQLQWTKQLLHEHYIKEIIGNIMVRNILPCLLMVAAVTVLPFMFRDVLAQMLVLIDVWGQYSDYLITNAYRLYALQLYSDITLAFFTVSVSIAVLRACLVSHCARRKIRIQADTKQALRNYSKTNVNRLR